MVAATSVLDGALERLRAVESREPGPSGANGWLASGRETVLAVAPGRLDVMGGIADYSGATVLEATIGQLAVAAAQRRDDALLRVRTIGPEAGHLDGAEVTLRLDDFFSTPGARDRASLKPYDAVRALFSPTDRWAAYLLGTIYVLLAEGELPALATGCDLLLHSTVPVGAGVASSAAIEVAAMSAVAALYGATTGGLRLAALCQLTENRVAGAPCGIMDQVTCTLGQAGRLLALRCRPHEILGYQAPPPGFGFAGLDSGVKHAVGGQRYPVVRCAAFMGRQIIRKQLAGAGEDPARCEYLCQLTPEEYRRRFRGRLPRRLRGQEFLERWGETGDAATTIDPGLVYPVRGATEHPIAEQRRVERFLACIQQAAGGDAPADPGAEARRPAMRRAGRLMYGSHRSYSRNCGLGAQETNRLVSLVRRARPEAGLYGAKITGGGSGGTVAVLLETGENGQPTDRAAGALEQIGDAYAAQVGRRPRLISGTLPGADAIGVRRISW